MDKAETFLVEKDNRGIYVLGYSAVFQERGQIKVVPGDVEQRGEVVVRTRDEAYSVVSSCDRAAKAVVWNIYAADECWGEKEFKEAISSLFPWLQQGTGRSPKGNCGDSSLVTAGAFQIGAHIVQDVECYIHRSNQIRLHLTTLASYVGNLFGRTALDPWRTQIDRYESSIIPSWIKGAVGLEPVDSLVQDTVLIYETPIHESIHDAFSSDFESKVPLPAGWEI